MFRYGSADNKHIYDHAYFDLGRDYQPHSKHGVGVETVDGTKHSAILLSTGGGATGIHDKMAVCWGEKLFVCGGNSVYALSLPMLTYDWHTEADGAACFELYMVKDSLIVRGEMNISKLSFNGQLLWQFSGRDIFVSPDGNDTFHLRDDYIEVTDWNHDTYRIDYDGNLLAD